LGTGGSLRRPIEVTAGMQPHNLSNVTSMLQWIGALPNPRRRENEDLQGLEPPFSMLDSTK